MKSDFSKELRNFPFVRIVFAFIAGIIVGMIFPIPLTIAVGVGIGFVGLFILTFFVAISYSARYIPGIFISLFFLTLGIWLVRINTPEIVLVNSSKKSFLARVDDIPANKDSALRVTLEILNLPDSSKTSQEAGKIIVYIKQDSNKIDLKYRDLIQCFARIDSIRNAGNPGEFDYKTYLFRRGITGRAFLQSSDIQILRRDSSFSPVVFAAELREKLSDLYAQYHITGQEHAVLSALTIGDQSEIDDDIKNAFSISGTTHVLSVSGMHVGLIYIVLNFFLKFLDRFKRKRFAYGKIIKAVILISFLIFYALLTGLSPAVNRAALMFSLFVIGTTVNRSRKIYNTMAFSAFILLIINPFLITDIGFQLSYLAVFAILFLQKKIEKLIYVPNLYIRKVWELLSVTLAAQIITFPLTLYYFHQFPNWFIITNLIIIPLSTVVIYLAVALLAISPFDFLADLVGFLLRNLLKILNESVLFVEKLPFPSSTNIPFGGADLILFYTALGFLLFWLLKKRNIWAFSFFSAVLILIGYNAYLRYSEHKNSYLTIYNIKGRSVVTFGSGTAGYLVSDTVLNIDEKKITYALGDFLRNYKTENIFQLNAEEDTSFEQLIIERKFINFKGKRIAIIDSKEQLAYETQNKSHVDLVLVANNPYISVDEINRLFTFKSLIFDSSNKPLRVTRWLEEAQKSGTPCHATYFDGAYTVNLNEI